MKRSDVLMELKPFFLRWVQQGVDAGLMGPALHKIILFHGDGSPVDVFDADSAGLDLALAAAATGDVVLLPAGTIAGNHTVGAGVEVCGRGRQNTILSGQITLADGAVLRDLSVVRAASQAGDLIGVVAPASGMAYVVGCDLVVNNATGDGFACYGALEYLTLRWCAVTAQSGGVDSDPFAPPADELSGYWTMDEASGTRVDATGHGLDLAETGTVGQVAGVDGNAASFPGTRTDVLGSSNDGFDCGNIDFTWFGWVYPISNGSSYDYILAKTSGVETQPRSGYMVCVSPTPGLAVRIADASDYVEANSAAALSAWHFFVAWHDAEGDLLCIQVDGGAVQQQATGGMVPEDAAYDLRVGDYPLAGYAVHMFQGYLDGLGFYKGVLAEVDRTWLYNGGSGRTWAEIEAYFGGEGTPYAYGCVIPNADGRAAAIPEWGDRSAWDVADYGARHASDWAAGDLHHPAVTLGAGSAEELTLDGQELTLAEVLTPTEHTAIGDAAPHHAAVTLGGGSDPALSLSGQQLTLADVLTPVEHDARDHTGLPGIASGTYRQFTYVPDGAGSFSFVVDDAGMPVFAQLDLEE